MAQRQSPEQVGSKPMPLLTVNEHAPHKTSVYKQGTLVRDGNDPSHQPQTQGQSDEFSGLNQMLKWGIEHSDPEELKKRADDPSYANQPSRVDQEVLDLILGQPIVAKMRACIGVVEENKDIDAQLEALEEIEYYVEDIDNANDFAKLGGLQLMIHLCGDTDVSSDVRASAGGICRGSNMEAR